MIEFEESNISRCRGFFWDALHWRRQALNLEKIFGTNSVGTTENPSAAQPERSANVPKVYIAWTMDDFAFVSLKKIENLGLLGCLPAVHLNFQGLKVALLEDFVELLVDCVPTLKRDWCGLYHKVITFDIAMPCLRIILSLLWECCKCPMFMPPFHVTIMMKCLTGICDIKCKTSSSLQKKSFVLQISPDFAENDTKGVSEHG